MQREQLIERFERMPVAVAVSDDDYRSVALPCAPFQEAKSIIMELVEGADLLEAA